MNNDGAHVVGVERAHAPEEEEERGGMVGHAVVRPRGELQLVHLTRGRLALYADATRSAQLLHEERTHRVVRELLRLEQRHGDLAVAAVDLSSCTPTHKSLAILVTIIYGRYYYSSWLFWSSRAAGWPEEQASKHSNKEQKRARLSKASRDRI